MRSKKNWTVCVLAFVATLNAITLTEAQIPLAQPALTFDAGGGATTLVRQPDGKVIAGGSFTKANGAPRLSLARLKTDGTLDGAFNPSPNGDIYDVAVFGSSIYVTGSFTRIAGVARARLAKLNMIDGSIDATFNPAPNADVSAISIDTDGNIYAMGAFTSIGGLNGRQLVKLDGSTGLADGAWNPTFPEPLTAVATIGTNGAYLYVVGYVATDANALIGRAYRFGRATGLYDTTWIPPASHLTNEGSARIAFDSAGDVFVSTSGGFTGGVYGGNQLALLTLEKFRGTNGGVAPGWIAPAEGSSFIVAGGTSVYTSALTPTVDGTVFPNSITKRNATTGAVASGWTNPDVAQGYVLAAVATPEGLWVAGQLSYVNTVRATGIARLDPGTGAVQNTISSSLTSPGAGAAVAALPNGKFLVGGRFDRVNDTPHGNLVRLNADGSIDPTWTSDTNGDIWRLEVSGSYIYAGGYFTRAGGLTRYGIARFDVVSGATDSGWNANINGAVRRIVFDNSDVYLVGNFTTVGALTRPGLAKISGIDGAAIGAFVPPFSACTFAGTTGLAYSAGFVYAGIPLGCISSRRFGRFSSTTGALDSAWNPAPNGSVREVLPNGGDVYVAGEFTSVGGVAKPRLAKIGIATGVLDATWGDPPIPTTIMYSARIVGSFIYTGGSTYDPVTGSRPIFGRHVLATGLRDIGWNPTPTPITPNATSLGNSSIAGSLNSDRVFIAANFATVSGKPRDGIAAFTANQPPLTAPTVIAATAGNTKVFVTFTVPSSDGGSTIAGYTAMCVPPAGASVVGTGLASPVTVSGLTNGTPYACSVHATNGIGVGPESAASNSVSPSPTSPPALIVSIAGSGAGTVTTAPAGINCPGNCLQTYSAGTAVVLTAAASGGSTFTGWLGACTGTGTCSVSINNLSNVSATFTPDTTSPMLVNVNGTSINNPLTDGLVLFRYLSGASASALTSGATAMDSSLLANRLNDIKPIFDIDRNGQADAATDGLMLLRYLYGLRGTALTAGAIGIGATRTNSTDIEAYIQSLLP